MSLKVNKDLCNADKSFQQARPVSPVSSFLSMKSDKSMNMPIQFKHGDSLIGQISGRSLDSSAPSNLSLKSDKSMNMPIQFKNNQSSDVSRVLSKTDDSANKRNTETNLSHQRHEPPSFNAEIYKRLKTQIKMRHQCVSEGFVKQGKPIMLNEIYTELYITESESGEISNEHEVRQIEKQSRRAATEDKPIKCNDIFKPSSAEDKLIRTVLTKGVTGIGKTVSVQKFVLDWAEGKENQDVCLIFPLPFREINLMKDRKFSLLDLLHVFFPETKEVEISSDEYKVLFIFDGLDECRLSLDFHSSVRLCDVRESASVEVLLINLIRGNLLPSALIWITSRPAAADLIPSECVDRVTEVRGFNDPQKEEYFRRRIGDESLACKIISHLKASRSLYIMCHIPVFCWISATVLEGMLSEAETGEIPKTLTQMYTHFLIIQTNIKHLKDYEKTMRDEDMVFKLGKLAFEQLLKGNLIFYEEDLRECDIDVAEASVYSGLCTQIFTEELGWYQGKVYCFVHLTIQEHLAALYMHLSFINNNVNVLALNESCQSETSLFSLHKCAVDKALQSNGGQLDLLLRFLMGFSMESNHNLLEGLSVKRTHSFQEREKTIKYLMEQIKNTICTNECLIFFHCLNELNEHSLTDQIQSYLNSTKPNQSLSHELLSALVYLLMTSDEKFDVFDLRKYGKSTQILSSLKPVLMLSTKALLMNCNITVFGCAVLSFILTSSSCVRQLDLSHNKLQDSGVEMLCVGEKRKKIVLQEGNWHLDNNKFEKIRSKHPSAGLQDQECALESLNLKNCGITEGGCVLLSSALSLNPSHLRELDLSWNHVGDSGAKHLCDVLENTECALQILKLNNCGITAEGCSPLASVLRSNRSHLTELELYRNKLEDSGVKLLSVGLANYNCKLEKLRLSNCRLTKDGVAALTEALKSNPSHLSEINLRENDLQESGLNVPFTIQNKVLI